MNFFFFPSTQVHRQCERYKCSPSPFSDLVLDWVCHLSLETQAMFKDYKNVGKKYPYVYRYFFFSKRDTFEQNIPVCEHPHTNNYHIYNTFDFITCGSRASNCMVATWMETLPMYSCTPHYWVNKKLLTALYDPGVWCLACCSNVVINCIPSPPLPRQ